MQEAADTGGMNMQAAFGQRRRQSMQRHVWIAGDLAKHEQPMIPADQMRPVAPHLARRNAAAQALARRPFDHARNRNPKGCRKVRS